MADRSAIKPEGFKLGSKHTLHKLTTRQVQTAGDGDHPDGGKLMLRVRGKSGAWLFRYTSPTTKRRREMGLGRVERGSAEQAGRSLTAARAAAQEARDLLRKRIDPIDHREQQTQAARQVTAERKADAERERWTLARAARDYHERIVEPTRTSKHAAQWLASLENHMPAALWHARIDGIEPPALLSALLAVKPHERARRHQGNAVPETVRRIRQRLDAIFEDAIFNKRATTNPAAGIKRKMREAKKPGERAGAFRALPYKEAPALMAALRFAEGVSARCLEFTVLTAARTSEALFAEWSEFDLTAEVPVWTVPGSRLKTYESHTVYLPPRAVEIIESMKGLDDKYVFASSKGPGKAMSNMAMLAVLDRLGARDRTTVHGLARATFSTWANETAAARPDVIEACLAHHEADHVRAAYNRALFNDERRALLAAWQRYLERPPASVIDIQRAALR